MDSQQRLFTIQQLSQRLSIPKPTLRFWEKEFEGILVPQRTEGGQRRYSIENLSTIAEIRRLKKKGMSLGEIKRKLSDSNNAKAGNSNSNELDLLAEKVAEAVKAEIYSFFEGEAA